MAELPVPGVEESQPREFFRRADVPRLPLIEELHRERAENARLRADLVCRRQEIAALCDVLSPFLTLDRDLGDEWADVCELAREMHAALAESPSPGPEGQA